MARWHLDLQEYDYEILYIPGKENAPPNALSRPPGVDQGKEDNQGIMVLPLEKFKIQTTMDDDKIQVPLLDDVKGGIMNLVHNHLTAGHPEQDEMIRKTQEHYYWPGMKEWITEYVKGCITCQQNKILTHRRTMPMYHIPMEENM
jgi:hypothetical protein